MEIREADVVVVGAGLAGLMAALSAVEEGSRVIVLSKGRPNATEIVGFNVPGLSPGDSTDEFYADTLRAGESVNNPRLVARMAAEITGIFRDLERRGLKLTQKDGSYQLRIAADSRYPRIVYSGDRTGPHLVALLRREIRRAGVSMHSSTAALKLALEDGAIGGLWAWDTGARKMVAYRAGAVVLASGGAGQLYAFNTNAPGVCGQGYWLALQAGASLIDMEFVQFEPFILVHPPAGRGYAVPTTVITNDGGRITNSEGTEFLPRDERGGFRGVTKWAMARAMFLEAEAGKGSPHGGVYLDLRHLPEKVIAGYPRLQKAFARTGIDPGRDLLEVAPAAHHFMGGILVDENGFTGIPGLYAAGETAGGLHGANRMAGNSGPDAFVFGRAAGMQAAGAARTSKAPDVDWEGKARDPEPAVGNTSRGPRRRAAEIRAEIRRLMWSEVGVARTAEGLQRAAERLRVLREEVTAEASRLPPPESAELDAMAITAQAVAEAASLRQESRGAHFRSDFPVRDDGQYLGSFVLRLPQAPGGPLPGAGPFSVQWRPLKLDGFVRKMPGETNQERRSQMRNLLLLDPKDNVAVALSAIQEGQPLEIGQYRITARRAIPLGHKVALRDIAEGGEVVKYGEDIGRAKALIRAGEHVHIHNVLDVTEEVVARERARLGL